MQLKSNFLLPFFTFYLFWILRKCFWHATSKWSSIKPETSSFSRGFTPGTTWIWQVSWLSPNPAVGKAPAIWNPSSPHITWLFLDVKGAESAVWWVFQHISSHLHRCNLIIQVLLNYKDVFKAVNKAHWGQMSPPNYPSSSWQWKKSHPGKINGRSLPTLTILWV